MIHLVCLTKPYNELDFKIWYNWHKLIGIDKIHIVHNDSDLRIDREGKVSVKAFNGVMCDNTPVATWTSIGKTYRLGDLPPSYFAKIGDIFILI